MQSDERCINITSFRVEEISRYERDFCLSSGPACSARSLPEVFSELLDHLHSKVHFDHLAVGLYNPRTKVLDLMLQAGGSAVPPVLPVSEASLGLVVERQQTIEVSDIETETRFPDLLARARKDGFRSFLIVPLSTHRQRLGTLAVLRRQAGNFSSEDLQYLIHTAQLVALVLENKLMADGLSNEKARLEMLLDVHTTLSSSLDVQTLFGDVSALVRRIANHDYMQLALYEPHSNAMKFFIAGADGKSPMLTPETEVPVSECPAGMAYLQGQMRQFSHADLEGIGSQYAQKLLAEGIRSIACFPLTNHGRKIGVLGLSSKREDNISEQDMVLLTQIAAQVAVAIDNARAYEEIARLKDKLSKEKLYLEDEIQSQHNFGEMVGNSEPLREVLKTAEIAAPSDATVLIMGETGTGKELVARAVHRLSARHEGNFIKLNCAAIPTGLLESELFGHEKGAFTGAISQKIGRLELADKGTLFLDEIGEIPLELQPKLLRVLQDHEFERLGGVKTINVDVRIIAATNRDLSQAVEQHQFRTDLFYRLNVFPIKVPALRERPEDIPLLVHYFIQKFARRMGKTIESIPCEILRAFEQWQWPGNIRELENFIERSVILTRGSVFYAPIAELSGAPGNGHFRGSTLEDMEREYILRILRESGGVIAGNQGAAARLGMKRTTLQSRMQKLGISREEYQA